MSRALRVAVLVASLVVAARAQAADHLRLERLDVSHWPTVQMYLTYLDGDGRAVAGRGKEDFKLILDSAEQGAATAVKTFDATGEPVNVVIVAQVTGAMNEVIDEIKKGARAICDTLDPKTKPKVAVLGYAADTKRVAELGPAADAESALGTMAIDTEGVEVHMLDTVRTAIDLLNAAPKGERKLIVLFSDGIDANLDRKAFTSIGKRAQENGIIIDSIGYAPFEPAKLKSLGELSKQSQGTERQCKNAGDVTAQFQSVADEIKKQYLVTFEVALNADAKQHAFQAIVDAQGRTAYSNNVDVKIPDKNFHPKVDTKKEGSRWWLWVLIGVGGLAVILFLAWLIFREKDEPFEAEAPAPVVAPSVTPQKQRTIALDTGAPGKPAALGWMVATSGRHANQTFKFKPGRTLIGTGADCDIVIEDQFMSSHHCEVRVEPSGSYKLVDLGSTNGIVVNDKKVREHELVDNDVFRLGRTEFKFKSIS
jgi:hypothetical protein